MRVMRLGKSQILNAYNRHRNMSGPRCSGSGQPASAVFICLPPSLGSYRLSIRLTNARGPKRRKNAPRCRRAAVMVGRSPRRADESAKTRGRQERRQPGPWAMRRPEHRANGLSAKATPKISPKRPPRPVVEQIGMSQFESFAPRKRHRPCNCFFFLFFFFLFFFFSWPDRNFK